LDPEPIWTFWRGGLLALPAFEPWAVQSKPNHYTDYDTRHQYSPCKIYYTGWKYLYEEWQNDDSVT